MIMRAKLDRIDPPPSRHAQMEDHCVAAVGGDQAIFGAPPEPGDPRPGQPLAEIVGEGAAEVSAAQFDPPDPPPVEHLGQTANGGFDFG